MILNLLGPLGIGKTTIIENIKKSYDINIVKERFMDNPYWGNQTDNKTILLRQIVFMNQYIENFNNIDPKENYILDQQMFAGLAFTKTSYDLGQITKTDYEQYKTRFFLIWDLIEKAHPITIDNLININLIKDPDKIHKQIKKRGRKEEQGITKKYIESLDKNLLDICSYISVKYNVKTYCIPTDKLKEDQIPETIELLLKGIKR